MKLSKLTLVLVLAASLFAGSASAVSTDKPSQYFNDYAHVLSAERDSQLNDQLADYERKTTNQFVVVVEPDKTLDQPIEQIGIDLARKWGIGQKGADGQLGTANRNNGVLFLVFPAAHKMRLEVGRGLEGSLPDLAANDILRNVVAPQFKQNNFDAGLTQGISAVEARANTEGNKGVNRTVEEQKRDRQARQVNNKNQDHNTVANTNAEPSGGVGFGTMLLFLLFIVVILYVGYRLFFKSSDDFNNNSYGTNIRDDFDSYHNSNYTPAPVTPSTPTPRPTYEPRRWNSTYVAPKQYPSPKSHSSVVAPVLAGAAAGVIADEVLSSSKKEEEKKSYSSDDSGSGSVFGGASSSWSSSPSDDSSSSGSTSSPSYSDDSSSSSSSWSDSSSSSDFGSGGGDFGGGGSSSDW